MVRVRVRGDNPVRWALVMVVLAVFLAGQVLSGPPAVAVTIQIHPIEAVYTMPGPIATTTEVVAGQAGTGQYQVFRPASYEMLWFRSPIVAWGDGTNAIPEHYSALLNHFASYGFTVIAPISRNAGSGVAIAAAARYLVDRNSDAASIYHDRLDVHRIAAVGHSQGGGGAVRAAASNPALISTVMTFSLPDPAWVSVNPGCVTRQACSYDTAALTQPVFLVGTHGLVDSLIASVATERTFFQRAPGHAALGLLQDSAGASADHTTVQDNDRPIGLFGYATAWLCAQLRDDSWAATAFSGSDPELVGNSNWPGSAVK